jgi:hypothetical protein
MTRARGQASKSLLNRQFPHARWSRRKCRVRQSGDDEHNGILIRTGRRNTRFLFRRTCTGLRCLTRRKTSPYWGLLPERSILLIGAILIVDIAALTARL